MPTRIIREGILTSEPINALSCEAELFYRRLMSVVDDYGRYFAHPSLLRAACFPLQLDKHSEADVKRMLTECESSKTLLIYGNSKYVLMPNFRQQTRAPSKFPEPAEAELLNIRLASAWQKCSESESESESESKTKAETVIPESLSREPFISAWKDWQRHRKELKKPLTATSVNRQMVMLCEIGVDRAVAAIHHSIASGWQGIYEPKHQPNFQRRTRPVPNL